ncbi:helix-turn-helix transcriptional regulator [Spongiibacter tropicus]|uniref:helix-turn-helix domain-containing protein n=1 Tax=Spongiibacter tropicus TaxID=454602 RepID=UPI002353958E|nr:helix-turn-helix transcriptional regulator [Spongiibacter tropicus]|tara:strand:+ start:11499 stop:11948 length:450 start_codon:yes stop_codon:yes gene_type:complete
MKITLKNNVRTTMASRDITMWKDLAERLKNNQDYSITRTSLARQIEQETPAYSLSLIEALCNELQCLPNDLFRIEITEATADDIRNLTRREKPFEFGHIIEADSATSKESPATNADSASQQQDDFDDEDELVGGRVSHQNAGSIRKREK